MEETASQATDSEVKIQDEGKNLFSEPWNDSDVVLLVEDKGFHVHRCMLSLQSPVFKAMFNGNFKDATQDKIELKNDKHEPMLLFLQLLYPPNMLNKDVRKADIKDENVLSIVELADKYRAKNVIKQCLTHIEHLRPENTMRLLPFAARHGLALENVFDVISRHIPTNTLGTFASELDNDSVYIKALAAKCRVQENAIQQANTMMMHLLKIYVTAKRRRAYDHEYNEVKCVEHNHLDVQDLQKVRKCKHCLMIYTKSFIDNHVQRFAELDKPSYGPLNSSMELIELLWLTEDIATSLQK